jgi:hypothetical protein
MRQGWLGVAIWAYSLARIGILGGLILDGDVAKASR